MTRVRHWFLLGLAVSATMGLAAPAGPTAPTEGREEDEEASRSAEFDELYRQIHGTSENLRGDPTAENRVRFVGGPEAPDLSSGMRALGDANPLLTEQCKKEALRRAIDGHARLKGTTVDESLEAIRNHVRQRQAIVTAEGVSTKEFFRHLTECKGFCGPHAVELLGCHVLAVAGSNHDIVLFDWDSAWVTSKYNEGVVRRYADLLAREASRQVLLVGRASPPGPSTHNLRLSADRTRAVRDRLMRAGVSERRISTLWLGEEPPQLERWMAERYGFGALERKIGSDPFNQSVVVVVY